MQKLLVKNKNLDKNRRKKDKNRQINEDVNCRNKDYLFRQKLKNAIYSTTFFGPIFKHILLSISYFLPVQFTCYLFYGKNLFTKLRIKYKEAFCINN